MVLGSGSLCSTRVLGAETFAQMLQPQEADLAKPGMAMALAWVVGEANEAPFYWHNGGWPGANTELAVLPRQHRTVLVFANTLGEALDDLCFSLVKALVKAD